MNDALLYSMLILNFENIIPRHVSQTNDKDRNAARSDKS